MNNKNSYSLKMCPWYLWTNWAKIVLQLVEYLHLHEILYQFSDPLDEENVNELAESQLQNKLDDQSPPTEDTIKQGKKKY